MAKDEMLNVRKVILKKASDCVCGSREQDYGSPENTFEAIANFWATYLQNRCANDPRGEVDLKGSDVAAMMALMKLARISSGKSKQDNWVDLAGYAACGGELELEQETNHNEEDEVSDKEN